MIALIASAGEEEMTIVEQVAVLTVVMLAGFVLIWIVIVEVREWLDNRSPAKAGRFNLELDILRLQREAAEAERKLHEATAECVMQMAQHAMRQRQ